MALQLYFSQVRNDPTEVEYQFGESKDNLDRTLTIDKATEAARSNQPEDAIFRTMAGRIVHLARREKQWPPNGMIAS